MSMKPTFAMKAFYTLRALLRKKTGGSVKIDVFPSATLHGWSEGVDSVQGGVSDISWINADNRLLCYAVTSLYPTEVSLQNQIALDADYADLIRDEAAKAGLVLLFNSNYSYDQEWWFEQPINDIGRLEGKLVRSIGPLVSMMISAWGASLFLLPRKKSSSRQNAVLSMESTWVLPPNSSWKLWTVMPYMVNANLLYGNIQYMVNKAKFESLTTAEQAALTSAAVETEKWLQPRYEAWVDAQVGKAVMQGGGAAVSLSDDQRAGLIASVKPQWDEKVNAACGREQANAIRALFEQHAP